MTFDGEIVALSRTPQDVEALADILVQTVAAAGR